MTALPVAPSTNYASQLNARSCVVIAGPADILDAAWDADRMVTVNHGPYAGESVRLGATYQTYIDDAVTTRTQGLVGDMDHAGTTIHVYAIDESDMAEAPGIAAVVAQIRASESRAAFAAEARAAADDRRLDALDD